MSDIPKRRYLYAGRLAEELTRDELLEAYGRACELLSAHPNDGATLAVRHRTCDRCHEPILGEGVHVPFGYIHKECAE